MDTLSCMVNKDLIPDINTFVFSENDNLYIKLVEKGIDVRRIKNQIKNISAKVHNNKIGYARLESDFGIIKVIVCPKVFDYNENDFLSFFNSALNVINKYKDKARYFKVDNTLLNLAVLKEKENEKSLSFDSLLELKFKVSLNEISVFFKRKNFRSYKKVSFYSNSIENELDLVSSIRDPIKSNIHQYKRLFDLDTQIAESSLMVIDLFIKKNKHYISPETIALAKKVYSKIKKDYGIKRVKTTINQFMHHSFGRLFNTQKKKELFHNLLNLLSQEDFFNTSYGSSLEDRFTNSSSYFFEANIIFEYLVYDWLVNSFPEDNIKIKPRLSQDIYSKSGVKVGEVRSEPDFLHENNGLSHIIDAKWKVLNKLGSSFNYDVLKSKRDLELFKADDIYLVYPVINEEIAGFSPVYFCSDQNFPVYLKELCVIN